jgi:hypothetical protein
MVAVIKIRNLKTDKRKAHANSKKGTQNLSTMPPDPKVEREEKGRNALTTIKDSI